MTLDAKLRINPMSDDTKPKAALSFPRVCGRISVITVLTCKSTFESRTLYES